jgi:hypothetical protein
MTALILGLTILEVSPAVQDRAVVGALAHRVLSKK